MEQENIKVVVRCRPMNEIELNNDSKSVVHFLSDNTIAVDKNNGYQFTFDAVYSEQCSQEMLFNEIVGPLLNSVLNGFNGCIFAYGQTSTGKTFTMEGDSKNPQKYGIIPRVFDAIFTMINVDENTEYSISASYIEVYNDNLRDLLSCNNEIRMFEVNEQNVIPNLRVENCQNVDELKRLLLTGNQQRTVGKTNMNESSSRSHAIFSIKIEMHNYLTGDFKVGKLNLVDLAGSERITKSCVVNQEFKETTKINCALLALGNVIAALVEGGHHVPFRESKLTRLLQDSLGGNSKTVMIATISPSKFNIDETLSTLRFADRVKTIQNKPVINENSEDSQIRFYKLQIETLKKLIEETKNKGSPSNYNGSIKGGKKVLLKQYLDLIHQKTKNGDDNNSDEHKLNGNKLKNTNKQMTALKTSVGLSLEAEKLTDVLVDSIFAFKELQQNILDTIESHKKKRNELAKLEAEAIKNYKMKEIIIKYFIPPNEQEGNATMDYNQNMPESIHIDSNGSYLNLDLDIFRSSLLKYTNPEIPPNIQALIEEMFQPQEEISILEPIVRNYRSKSASRTYKCNLTKFDFDTFINIFLSIFSF